MSLLPAKPERRATPADLCCDLSAGNIESALHIWRVMNIHLARECVRLIPDSRAAVRLLVAARRDELPLCNYLPDNAGSAG